MKKRLAIAAITGIVFLSLFGCTSQNILVNRTEKLANTKNQPSINVSEENHIPDSHLGDKSESDLKPSQNTVVSPQISYWDEFAKSYGGTNAYFGELPKEVDLLPLYISGMQHKDSYVRWTCAYKAFDYIGDAREPEIIKSLQPLLADPVQQVREAAKFSTEVLAETFKGPEFIHSPNGKDVAFNPFINMRYNDGKLWVYSSESHQLSMALQLTSIGGDSGVAGYIHWSPDGSKLAVGDGGRLWSDTVILKMDTLTTNKQSLISYLEKNGRKFGYNKFDSQRPDPGIRFLEWSPDSKKVLLSYYFAEDAQKWQSGFAVYNSETDKYERIIQNKPTEDEYPQLEKPVDFKW